jgi:hypothetical protein
VVIGSTFAHPCGHRTVPSIKQRAQGFKTVTIYTGQEGLPEFLGHDGELEAKDASNCSVKMSLKLQRTEGIISFLDAVAEDRSLPQVCAYPAVLPIFWHAKLRSGDPESFRGLLQRLNVHAEC